MPYDRDEHMIAFPPPAGASRAHGHSAYLQTVLDVEPATLASHMDLSLDVYLERVDKWAKGIGLPYGVVVDFEAGTVTQLGD